MASATPMQMHPHEAWDLLELLGLVGRWAESATAFVKYYSELRQPFPNRHWRLLERLSADFFADPAAHADPVLDAEVRRAARLGRGSPIIRAIPRERAHPGRQPGTSDRKNNAGSTSGFGRIPQCVTECSGPPVPCFGTTKPKGSSQRTPPSRVATLGIASSP